MIIASAAFSLAPALVAASAMAITCGALSVLVVTRRWAFIGEGISHSGFGGAGTAWVIALVLPQFDRGWLPYAGVVVFCLATALAIGYLSRGRLHSDTAIGIFMVASLAWGFVAYGLYQKHRHMSPAGWDRLLLGQVEYVSPQFALAAVLVCLAVMAALIGLGKEILAYCFDPALAEASGVRTGFIHYLLMLLVTLAILLGVSLAGNVLVTALLVLPGATALLSGRRLATTLAGSVLTALLGAVGGLLVHARWPFMPAGPSIVLLLFLLFLGAFVTSRLRGSALPAAD